MRFVGRGHPAIRATHDKTLELAADDSITARATCIVAVGTTVEPPAPLAGPIRLRLAAAGRRFSVDAIANPLWDPSAGAIVRRSRWRRPDTFATEADAASSDLPRELVAALADPDVLVTVDVAPRPAEVSTLVLFAATGPSPALDAELAAADLVLALDDGARRLIGRHEARPGGRTLVVATEGIPRAGARSAGRVEVLGLPPLLAAVAAHPDGGPVLVGGEPAGAAAAALLVPGAEVAALVAAHPGSTVAPLGGPIQRDAGDLPAELPVGVCVPAAADAGLDPRVRAAVESLLADGVPTKTAARALRALTGWEQRRAYDTVLTWRR